MREPIHRDGLETFLHKQVEDHRMYPSDQLWRNLQKELHGEGRWPALTYISLFIIAALSVCTMMVKPEERLHKNTIVYPPQKEETVSVNGKENGKNTGTSAPVQYAYTESITQQTMQSVSEAIIAREEKNNPAKLLSLTKESLLTVQDKAGTAKNKPEVKPIDKSIISKEPEAAKAATVLADAVAADEKPSAGKQTSLVQLVPFAASKPASRYFSTIGLMKLSDLKKPSEPSSSSVYNNDDLWRTYPLLTAREIWRKRLSKFSFQFYITPSVSYRSLNDAHGKIARSYTAFPRANSYHLDVNRVVEHRAEMGAEVGFALGYKLSNTLTAKGGLQFNVRQYGIKAYTVPASDPSAQVVTDNASGAAIPVADGRRIDNAYLTSADAAKTSGTVVLNNRYYELSLPVGIDWQFMTSDNGKLSLNAAASVQPTYTFDKEPFVITTDYKSYTDGASIMHNWNLNSNAEMYISYKMGTFRWQVGPQFRFQHFSTYSNAYPVREHLLDYGLKIAFTKSLD